MVFRVTVASHENDRVVPLLEEYNTAATGNHQLRLHVDSYLQMFAEGPAEASVRLLRGINWAALPIHWQPCFLTNLPVRVTRHESQEAQRQLVKRAVQRLRDSTHHARQKTSAATASSEQHLVQQATQLLARITGVQH